MGMLFESLLSICFYVVVPSMALTATLGTHFGLGYHFYSLPDNTQVKFLQVRPRYQACINSWQPQVVEIKECPRDIADIIRCPLQTQYAFNILYTIGYPLSRISLVLLYRRIFVQQWFRVICTIFVVIYACYAISTALADVWLTIPIAAYWDRNITASKTIDENELYLANAGFNIGTDCILLILPLSIIWQLHMDWINKVALSWIFALGALTMIASIVRLRLFFVVNGVDPSCKLSTPFYIRR